MTVSRGVVALVTKPKSEPASMFNVMTVSTRSRFWACAVTPMPDSARASSTNMDCFSIDSLLVAHLCERQKSELPLGKLRFNVPNNFGVWFLAFGLGVVCCSFFLGLGFAISQEFHFLPGVGFDRIENPLVLALVHAQDHALGSVLLMEIDIEPVALGFRQHDNGARAK